MRVLVDQLRAIKIGKMSDKKTGLRDGLHASAGE